MESILWYTLTVITSHFPISNFTFIDATVAENSNKSQHHIPIHAHLYDFELYNVSCVLLYFRLLLLAHRIWNGSSSAIHIVILSSERGVHMFSNSISRPPLFDVLEIFDFEWIR